MATIRHRITPKLFFIIFFLIIFSSTSWASIVGSWDVFVSEKLKLKIKGLKTEIDIKNLPEQWIFYGNGSFEKTDDISGVWIQRGRKYEVFLNEEDVIENLKDLLANKGFSNTIINITKQRFIVKEKNNNKLQGKYLILADITFESGNIGRIKIKGKCTGSLDEIPPTIPSNLSTVAISETQINLSWDASTDNFEVAGYKIYRDGTYLDATSEIQFNDMDLNENTEYCYSVAAYDFNGNESNSSDEVCTYTIID